MHQYAKRRQFHSFSTTAARPWNKFAHRRCGATVLGLVKVDFGTFQSDGDNITTNMCLLSARHSRGRSSWMNESLGKIPKKKTNKIKEWNFTFCRYHSWVVVSIFFYSGMAVISTSCSLFFHAILFPFGKQTQRHTPSIKRGRIKKSLPGCSLLWTGLEASNPTLAQIDTRLRAAQVVIKVWSQSLGFKKEKKMARKRRITARGRKRLCRQRKLERLFLLL